MSDLRDGLKAWLIAALLIVAVYTLRCSRIFPQEAPISCYPAEVNWRSGTDAIRSFGCVAMKGDSLVLIPHFLNGSGRNGVILGKEDVQSVTLYEPKKVFRKAN